MGPPDSEEARVGTGPLQQASTRQADTQIITGPTDTPQQQIPTSVVPDAAVSSQQVSFWDVHSFVAPILAAAGCWPMAGTPAWCALDNNNPVKIAALFDAAQHWALRVATCQQAECEASHAISAAEDWAAISREIKNHNDFYAEKPWMKRKTS